MRALIETRNESGVDSFGNDFVLDGLAKTLHQADDEDDERDADHHAEDREEAAQLVRANRVQREMEIFAKITLHGLVLGLRPQSFDGVEPRGAHCRINAEKQADGGGKNQRDEYGKKWSGNWNRRKQRARAD